MIEDRVPPAPTAGDGDSSAASAEEGLRLLQAFRAIPSPAVRAHILHLACAASEHDGHDASA